MTIKQVRILDIHPGDSFYGEKDRIIGKILTLDIEDMEYINGWKASKFHINEKCGYNYSEFCAIRIEEIEDVN
jgi:hypothetical protein